MTREQALNYLYSSGFSEEQVQAVVEALTDEDAISREAVIELLGQYGCTNKEGLLFKDLKSLPSVQPKPIECDDAISREATLNLMRSLTRWCVRSEDGKFNNVGLLYDDVMFGIDKLPSVQPSRKGHCKDCKYFEYDSVAKVDGVPLIVAHEICSKWGDGCKTREDGYCFLFESADMRGDTE